MNNTQVQQTESRTRQSGLTVSLSSPVISASKARGNSDGQGRSYNITITITSADISGLAGDGFILTSTLDARGQSGEISLSGGRIIRQYVCLSGLA